MKNNLPKKSWIHRSMLLLLLMVYSSSLVAEQYAYEPASFQLDISKNRLSIEATDRPFKTVAKALESKTGFNFAYNDKLENMPISISATDQTLEETLLELSKQYGLRFKQVNNTIHV